MNFKIYLFVLLAIVFTNCSHKHEQSENGTEENATLKLTAYSADFEVFAEADPFVVGKQSNVLSHFSNLPDFTALESGSMTIRLVIKGVETKQTLVEPTRKGIYSFDITPKVAGKGELIFDIVTSSGDYKLSVPDVEVFDDEQLANHKAQDAEVSTTNATFFTKEQSWKVQFATEHPKVEEFGQVIKTTALIKPAQGDEIIISSKTNGIIETSGKAIVLGRMVYKGEHLFNITGSGLANNNSAVRFTESQNNYQKTKLNYYRAKELAKDKIISNKELLVAKNQYLNAKVQYDNLSGNFSSSGEIVTSPMDGFVDRLYVKNGQYVEAGQTIVRISQNHTLMLISEVQQKYAPVLGAIKSANIRSSINNKVYTLEELNGEVLSFGRNTDGNNYLIPVTLQIDNVGDFISGGFVEVYLKTITDSNALTIPVSAIMEDQGVFYVYVQIHPELFEKREIVTGTTDGIRTEVIGGVYKNDRVVTKGAILIKLAQATGGLDAHSGHVH